MFSSSGYAVNRKWCTVMSSLDEGDTMEEHKQIEFLDSCQTQFCGWLLLHMMTIGSNGRRQMFYITFILQYFGLSRDGINVLSKYGFGVTLDMFDLLRQSYRAGSETMTRFNMDLLLYCIVYYCVLLCIICWCRLIIIYIYTIIGKYGTIRTCCGSITFQSSCPGLHPLWRQMYTVNVYGQELLHSSVQQILICLLSMAIMIRLFRQCQMIPLHMHML